MVKKGQVSEAKLTKEEKQLFSAAKDKSLKVYTDAEGWTIRKKRDAPHEKCAPLKYVMKWKHMPWSLSTKK